MNSSSRASTVTPIKRHSRHHSMPGPLASPSTLPTPTRQNSVHSKSNKRLSRVMNSSSLEPSRPLQSQPPSPSPSSTRAGSRLPTPTVLTPPGSPAQRLNNNSNTNTPLSSKNRDNIKVIVRFRPEFESEQLHSKESPSSLKLLDSTSLSIGGDTYTYDRVFGQGSTQEEVFAYSVEQTVEDLFMGYNGTVLAYGQTGSGKTFTMMGAQLHDSQRGMIPRISDAIFERMTNEQMVQKDDPTEYTLSCSYMEIYMEQVRDLLTQKQEVPLMIQEDGVNGVHVRNLTKRYVASSDELYTLLEKGSQVRAVGCTEMNQESSRSHAIFQLDLTQENVRDGIKRSKLFLVDLAGSEKVGKTGASGQTLEEAKKINSSLTHLGIVINALTDSKSSHIPYRDSKLTRILQQSLGGNARTSLIVNCSPASYNESETLSTLRFGTRAKRIKNKAHVNSEPSQLDLLKRIEQLTMMNAENELKSKELEFELDLWKTGVNKLSNGSSDPSPPPPPPKNAPSTMAPADLKKMIFLENRVQELTGMISVIPSISNTDGDQSLSKQLEESQSLNGIVMEGLNEKCIQLFEMQQEIDRLATKLQNVPQFDEEKYMAIEQTLITFTTKVAELENQNYMLQREIKTTRSISETRQERIKTLEELLKEAQSKVQNDTTNFEFKLFSLKERLNTARNLSGGPSFASNHSASLSKQSDAHFRTRHDGSVTNMSKIDENDDNSTDANSNRNDGGGGLGGISHDSTNMGFQKQQRSQSTSATDSIRPQGQYNQSANLSEESLMSMRRTHTRGSSVTSQHTSATSSIGSSTGNGPHGLRIGLNLNIVKPNPQSLSKE